MINKTVANAQTRYEITTNDLPLCCPTKSMDSWNSHPRVYLAIEKTGHATCPYCDAKFILTQLDSNSTAL